MNEKSSWKIAIYLLLFGILTVTSVFFKNFTTHTYSKAEVAGGDQNLELFVQPGAGTEPVVSAINGAQKEVLVEVYLLSDKEVLAALEAAHNRGVDVKVMLEQHPFGGGNVNTTTVNRLQSSGINFKWANPTFALTHEKSVIIDGQVVFILNQNLTTTAFKSNREFDVIDHNLADVTEVRQIFIADWNRSGVTPTAKNLVVSPDNSRGKLEGLIDSASKTIQIEAEVVDDLEMEKLLIQRASSGIRVKIITPDLKRINSNRKALDKLKSGGVQVKTLSSPYVHAKLILVDGVRSYTGSINLTTASIEQNRELGILVSQSDIINKEQEVFDQDWKSAQDFH